MAEKVLQTSADSYMKAKHPEKSDEIQRILEKVREERELAASLSEVLHAPPIASTTTSFTTPTPTHEKAVGLERFEHADIQAHLTVPEETTVGEDLEIQLDLVNVAKNFGLVVRIDNLIPKGFKVTKTSPKYAVKDGSIDMRGKRFEPLKVESIKISARATDVGVFKLNPQVVYVDEAGQFRSCKPEARHVKVRTPARRVTEERVAKEAIEREMRVFIGGNYLDQMAIINLMEEIVAKLGFTPVVVARTIVPPGETHHRSLMMLHTCKYAIFDVTGEAGQLMELERTFDYEIQPLVVIKKSYSKIGKLSEMVKTWRNIQIKSYDDSSFESIQRDLERLIKDYFKVTS